jgi:hypothetical protein
VSWGFLGPGADTAKDAGSSLAVSKVFFFWFCLGKVGGRYGGGFTQGMFPCLKLTTSHSISTLSVVELHLSRVFSLGQPELSIRQDCTQLEPYSGTSETMRKQVSQKRHRNM